MDQEEERKRINSKKPDRALYVPRRQQANGEQEKKGELLKEGALHPSTSEEPKRQAQSKTRANPLESCSHEENMQAIQTEVCISKSGPLGEAVGNGLLERDSGMGVTVKGPLAVSAGQEEGACPGTGLGEGQGEGVKNNTYTENTTPSQGTPDCSSTERTGLQTEETWYVEKVLNGDSGTLEHSISTALREDPSDQESDSWDTLFNDEGDCLDPHLLEEISQDQGKVKKSIQEPRFDYYNWAVESEVELRDDELSHIDLQVPFRVQNRGSAPNFQQLPVDYLLLAKERPKTSAALA
ncbi:UNVERIFIED_CONTAM: hypothetical protein FKN15_021237 [Acipenser sinensis]